MRSKIKLLIILAGIISHVIPGYTQKQDHVYFIRFPDRGDNSEPLIFNDSIEAVRRALNLVHDLRGEGFLTANFIYRYENQDKQIIIEKGERFQWAELSAGNLPKNYQGNFNFEQKFHTGKPFSFEEIQKIFQRVISLAENRGYPFASIKLDSVQFGRATITACLNFDPGPYITYDSLKLKGFNTISNTWLAAYLNMQPGNPFQENTVAGIPDKIAQLKFVKLINDPEVTFQNQQAVVILNLEHVRGNQIDAIVGFAPGASANNSLLITGEADLLLNNLFSRGHTLSFGWRSVRPMVQEIDFFYAIPNILNSPVSVTGIAEMYRQDSSFFNYNMRGEISLRKDNWLLGTYAKFFRSSANGEEDIENEARGVKVNYLGLVIDYGKRRRHDFLVETSLGIGKRSVEEKSYTSEGIQTELLILSRIQLNRKGSFFRIQPIFHWLNSDNLFVNDLLRIGGINSLRGFPENYFFVDKYITLRNEYHWLFEDNSSFFLLVDGGFIGSRISSYAYGLGLGFDLKVNNGIFELIYAVGGYENVNLSFDRSIIHFGYKAVF